MATYNVIHNPLLMLGTSVARFWLARLTQPGSL